ncbi:MAG: class I SAM-dependent methyltransferase [Ilumatobacter sp.]|nr:class I SAM-dependent methyltransferase [Ilumatobacter sp.]
MSNEERDRLSAVYGELLGADSAKRWSLTNAGNDAILRQRVEQTTRFVDAQFLPRSPAVLDFGSGGETTLCPRLGARTDGTIRRVGVDILLERLRAASGATASSLVCADGQSLPFENDTFDVAAVFTVFSSILDGDVRRRIAAELVRTLKPGGFVIWYDLRYRNPANRNLQPLSRRAVERLFPTLTPTWTSTTVLPPLARRLTPLHRRCYAVASALPMLRSHLLGTLSKPQTA